MNALQNFVAVTLLACLSVAGAQAATPDDLIQSIQKRWAEIKYQLPEKQQADQYQALAQESRRLADANPGVAEVLIWEGIVLSSEAGVRSGLGALSLAKEARQRFDEALTH